jgi:4-hydroxybenzoate polyprenyltransferase
MTGALRGWLLLSRLSNLPTIATNVLASGVIAGGGRITFADWLPLAVAVSAIYVAGMVFNDVCDVEHDRRLQPNRPLVSGSVTIPGAVAGVIALSAAGLWLIADAAVDVKGPVAALGLLLTIAAYDLHHKQNAWAPILMGMCRGLVWVVVALALRGRVDAVVLAGATVMVVYVTGLTVAARRVPAVRPNVPLLIAAISVVDGLALAATGAWGMALLALAAVPVTLLLQRVIPGD